MSSQATPGSGGLTAVAIAVVIAGKSVAVWITGWFYDYSRMDRWLMVGLTTPQAAATLAVTVTASELGAFDSLVVDVVILVILVSCLGGPLLCGYAGRHLAGQRQSGLSDQERPRQAGEPSQEISEEPKKDFR